MKVWTGVEYTCRSVRARQPLICEISRLHFTLTHHAVHFNVPPLISPAPCICWRCGDAVYLNLCQRAGLDYATPPSLSHRFALKRWVRVGSTAVVKIHASALFFEIARYISDIWKAPPTKFTIHWHSSELHHASSGELFATLTVLHSPLGVGRTLHRLISKEMFVKLSIIHDMPPLLATASIRIRLPQGRCTRFFFIFIFITFYTTPDYSTVLCTLRKKRVRTDPHAQRYCQLSFISFSRLYL